MLDGDGFVQMSRLEPARAERREDDVGSLQSPSTIRLRFDPDVARASGRQDPLRQSSLELQRVGVDVLQHDTGVRESFAMMRQSGCDPRHVRGTTTDDADGCHGATMRRTLAAAPGRRATT